jgi:DNA-binding response OmpR family regulator
VTILLVEDDFSSRRALDAFLTQQGFQVLCTANSGEGLAVLDTYALRPDVIVLDIADSGRFLLIQRELPRVSNIPAIVLATDAHGVASFRSNRVLRKPIDRAELLKAIRELA